MDKRIAEKKQKHETMDEPTLKVALMESRNYLDAMLSAKEETKGTDGYDHARRKYSKTKSRFIRIWGPENLWGRHASRG